jgi:hypothetical protein
MPTSGTVTATAQDLSSGATVTLAREQVKLNWIQPQASAGFGPPGSLVVQGNATGAPAGAVVKFFWRDVTAAGPWTQEPFTPTPDASGTWYHSIPNVNYGHRYAAQAQYDVVSTAAVCTWFPNTGYTAC